MLVEPEDKEFNNENDMLSDAETRQMRDKVIRTLTKRVMEHLTRDKDHTVSLTHAAELDILLKNLFQRLDAEQVWTINEEIRTLNRESNHMLARMEAYLSSIAAGSRNNLSHNEESVKISPECPYCQSNSVSINSTPGVSWEALNYIGEEYANCNSCGRGFYFQPRTTFSCRAI